MLQKSHMMMVVMYIQVFNESLCQDILRHVNTMLKKHCESYDI